MCLNFHLKSGLRRPQRDSCDLCLCLHSAHFHICAVLCVLSCVCSHLCALICVLSYVCSQMCALLCALTCVLSCVCFHLCVALIYPKVFDKCIIIIINHNIQILIEIYFCRFPCGRQRYFSNPALSSSRAFKILLQFYDKIG